MAIAFSNSMFNSQSPYIVWLAAVIVAILVGIITYLLVKLSRSDKQKKDMEARFQQVENQVNSLQLETLESRLNPHLFKNILNSIQSHAYQTYFALDKLGNVLDYILYESRKNW
ncbi:histidine kinase [Niabella hibiscisoli]|uniref:histidine kinase n=1 Tax=Niabella hibiscisoli TaxID=1825928 RepID=UPI001F0D49B1|nr:histidine kinase [Niabella hibiscisoli]MCH5720939.1 histidine kinase [Niabella hibiscisoli]